MYQSLIISKHVIIIRCTTVHKHKQVHNNKIYTTLHRQKVHNNKIYNST